MHIKVCHIHAKPTSDQAFATPVYSYHYELGIYDFNHGARSDKDVLYVDSLTAYFTESRLDQNPSSEFFSKSQPVVFVKSSNKQTNGHETNTSFLEGYKLS